MKKTNKKELILVGAILVAAAGMWTAFNWNSWFSKGETADYYVEVQVNGELVQSVPITAHGTYQVANPDSTKENVFVIDEEGVHMESASCPDKVCVGQGTIQPGTVLPICCLPNLTYIHVVAAEERQAVSGESVYDFKPADYITSIQYDNLEYVTVDTTVTQEEIDQAKEMYPDEYEARGEEGFLEMLQDTKAAYMQNLVWKQLWEQVVDQTVFSSVPEGEAFGDMSEDGRKEAAIYHYIAEKEGITVSEGSYLTGQAAEYELFEAVLGWLQEHAQEKTS
ncbi:MAG: NusG domain II-containing protein [Lachnospiraceae bacterium]